MEPAKLAIFVSAAVLVLIVFGGIFGFWGFLFVDLPHLLKKRKQARIRAKDPIAQMVDFKQARRRDEIRSWEEHWERIAGVCYSGYGVEPLAVEIRKAPPVIVLPDISRTEQVTRWLQVAEEAARKNDMVTYARVMDKLRAAQHA